MSLFRNTLHASEEDSTLPGNSENVERGKRKGGVEKKEGRWVGGVGRMGVKEDGTGVCSGCKLWP